MAYNVVVDGKIVRETLRAQDYGIKDGSFWFGSENTSTIGKIAKAPGVPAAKRDSKLRPWENTVRGAAERAGHSGEALRRLRIAVRSQRQRLVDFARQHPRHLTLIEFKEYKQLHGPWVEASRALWRFEHPGVPSPEFKLTRV
jgi:hypothetical protein